MAGAASPAKASTAGSNSRACGAFIRARKSSKKSNAPPWRGIETSDGKIRSARFAQPHHDIDARDLVALRRMRQPVEHHLGVRNVDQRVFAFNEEVVMV